MSVMVGLNMCDWTSCSSETFTAKYGEASHRRWHGAVIRRSALDDATEGIGSVTRFTRPATCTTICELVQLLKAPWLCTAIMKNWPGSDVLPEKKNIRLFGIRIFYLGLNYLGVEPIFWKLFMGVFEFRIKFSKIFIPEFDFSEKTRLVLLLMPLP